MEPVVVQAAYYRWFLQDQNLQAQAAEPEVSQEDTSNSSTIWRQIEMFPPQSVDDCFVFIYLAERWRLERGTSSSTTDMVLCPAYQSIIGMGPKAIPFILAQLASEGDDPDHWFWALQALTGANPVSEEDEGNLYRMARAWLQWAAAEGYAR
jgi:hypothetical protein